MFISLLRLPMIMQDISLLKIENRILKHHLEVANKDLTILKRSMIATENKNHLNTYNIGNEIYQFYDNALSFNPDITIKGIINANEEGWKEHPYYIGDIEFKAGDIILDIGANIGIFSIYLAKRFPDIKILAFEAVRQNYENLKRNIAINQANNVVPHHMAVTGDGRDVDIWSLMDLPGSSFLTDYASLPHAISRLGKADFIRKESVSSLSLDQILDQNKISLCKLLKIDVEGSEEEILKASQKLAQVEFIIGELHYGEKKNETLKTYLNKFFQPGKMRFEEIG